MKWSNVRLIFFRETRDQLRDRRMVFMIAVLPLLLYPLLGLNWIQVSQFMQEKPSRVLLAGASGLPTDPSLVDEDRFVEDVCLPGEAEKIRLDLDSITRTRADAEGLLAEGTYDAVIVFPPDFAGRLTEFQEQLVEASDNADDLSVPQPEIYFDTANRRSAIAHSRLAQVLRSWRDQVVRQTLKKTHVPATVTEPFQVTSSDVAEPSTRRAAQWSQLLPFVVVIWALTGAFYPAVDLCAGEKERGTLETLLSSPAARSEIVWGKLLTVMAFSMITSLLNLLSMAMTGVFALSMMESTGGMVEPPPATAIIWLVIGLIPIAALFSALALAIAAFARSSKEGQYYLMPLLLVTLPLMMLPMTLDLELGTALIPVTGLMLLLRELIEGQYGAALTYLPPVAIVTGGCCLLAVRWAVEQFHKESVMFRESERWGIGLWLRHVMRERSETPSIAEALLCAAVLLVIRFYTGFAGGSPDNWTSFATMTIVSQLAFIATPALLMTIILTRDPLRSLHLKPLPKQWLLVPAGALFALALHPASVWLSLGIRSLYPISEQAMAQLKPIGEQIQAAPLFNVLLVMAFLPAVCEELAFRGFILSGLRRTGSKWNAITITALLFGITHGVLQQSISATLVGLIIGYITIQSGSLLPAICFHFVHNSLGVLFSRLAAAAESGSTHYGFIPCDALLHEFNGHLTYNWLVVSVGLAASVGLFLWYRAQPYDRNREEQLAEEIRRQRRASQELSRIAAISELSSTN